jgi:hypothetical protein
MDWGPKVTLWVYTTPNVTRPQHTLFRCDVGDTAGAPTTPTQPQLTFAGATPPAGRAARPAASVAAQSPALCRSSVPVVCSRMRLQARVRSFSAE